MKKNFLKVTPSNGSSKASPSFSSSPKKKNKGNCNIDTASNSRARSEAVGGNNIALGAKDLENKIMSESKLLSKDKSLEGLLPPMLPAEPPKGNESVSKNSIVHSTSDPKNFLKVEEEPEFIKENETSLRLFENPEQTEENPKAFMETFGSWINDLFSGPNNKRTHASSKEYLRSYQQESDLHKDPDYFKSINALKKQFRKKLKSETSVHIAGGDKMFELDFDISGNEKKLKKYKSQFSLNRIKYMEEFFDACDKENFLSNFQDKTIKRQNGNIGSLNHAHVFNDGDTVKEVIQLRNSVDFRSSNFIREKKKAKLKSRALREGRAAEEFIFPGSQDFKKKLLLNISDQENCKQFYKNAPIDIQHYGQGKSKSYQNSTRCYTTNSNVGKTLGNSHSKSVISISNKFMSSHTIANDEKKAELAKSSKKTRKTICKNKVLSTGMLDLQKQSSSFVRVKFSKPAINIPTEPLKTESKGTSDDLVKYLMKRVRVHHRPQSSKKKQQQQQQSLIPAILPTNKTKFMQSATSSLVMSVLSKKDAEIAMPGKSSAIVPTTNNKLIKTDLPSKTTLPNKAWNPKFNDNNVRHEVKRVNFQNALNRNSYLSDEPIDVDRESYVFDKSTLKNSKRLYANVKAELKDTSDKNVKRDEVRSMLSSIDMRSNLYAQITKIKQNEMKKKYFKNMLNNADVIQASPDSKDNQSPRFQQQHELFKTNLKSGQQNINSDSLQDGKENQMEQNSSLSTQLIVVDDKFPLLPEEETVKCDTQNNLEGSVSLSDQIEASELKVLDCLNVEDKEINPSTDKKTSVDKPMMHKDKMLKNKTFQYMKDGDKVLLSPLSEYCNEKQKEQYQSSICSPDLRSVKSIETILLNRRFSTNTLGEKMKRRNRALALNLKALNSSAGDKDQKKPTSPGQSSCPDSSKSEEKKGSTIDCGTKAEEKKSSADDCGSKPEEKKGSAVDCGTKSEEKKGSAFDCGTKAEEKKGSAIDCGTKAEEKKSSAIDCGTKSEEKKGSAVDCGTKSEEKKGSAVDCGSKSDANKSDKDKGKDCGFEKSQKPGPVCNGEKSKK